MVTPFLVHQVRLLLWVGIFDSVSAEITVGTKILRGSYNYTINALQGTPSILNEGARQLGDKARMLLEEDAPNVSSNSEVSISAKETEFGFCRDSNDSKRVGKYCGCHQIPGQSECYNRFIGTPWVSCTSYHAPDRMCYGYSKSKVEPANCPPGCTTFNGTGAVKEYAGNGLKDAIVFLREATDIDCAISGFWKINEEIIVRFWKVDWDLSFFHFVGRGQCIDEGTRTYATWYASTGVTFSQCRVACGSSLACLGFEVSDSGACYLRYDADGFPEQAPDPLLSNSDFGDDGTGNIGGTAEPFDRYCYGRPSDGNGQTPAAPDGHYWRVMFFSESGSWAFGDEGTREGSLDVVRDRPAAFDECSASSPQVSKLSDAVFAKDVKVWWGTKEQDVWAGLPSATQAAHTWQMLDDAAAWDHTLLGGGSRCPIAKDVASLVGQLHWVQHALMGLRGCSPMTFARLSPETASLDQGGWLHVLGYNWKFAAEIFIRRLVYQRRQAVANENCFKKLLDNFWDNRSNVTFADVRTGLNASNCMELIPIGPR